MGINLNNYEEYFLDYREGRCSPEEMREVEAFLTVHPELRQVLEDYEDISVEAGEEHAFPLKNRLRKAFRPTPHIHGDNFEEWMIMAVEGLLDPAGEKELEEFLHRNPSMRYDLEKYRATRLTPDPGIRFPNPGALKRRTAVVSFSRAAWAIAAAAAVILLMFGLRLFYQTPDPVILNAPGIAESSTPEEASTSPTPASPGFEGVSGPDTVRGGISGTSPGTRVVLSAVERADPFRMGRARVGELTAAAGTPVLYAATRDIESGSAFTPRQAPLLARAMGGMLAKTGNDLRRIVRDNPVTPAEDVNFWTIASAGIKGFGTLTDRNLDLYVDRDPDGKVSSYALVEEDRLIMARSLNKN